MAMLQLRSRTLELFVRLGAMEEYKPDEGIKKIYKRLEKLKKKTWKVIEDIVGGKMPQEEANKIIKANKNKEKKWKKYLEIEYNKELDMIIKDIITKNIQICEGYADLLKSYEERKE